MAGLGDYKKGAKFTLRSGNGPLEFKAMGSTPLKDNGDDDTKIAKDIDLSDLSQKQITAAKDTLLASQYHTVMHPRSDADKDLKSDVVESVDKLGKVTSMYGSGSARKGGISDKIVAYAEKTGLTKGGEFTEEGSKLRSE